MEGIHKKIPTSVTTMSWLVDEKSLAILSYVTKNDEKKKNPGTNGLSKLAIFQKYLVVVMTRVVLASSFLIYNAAETISVRNNQLPMIVKKNYNLTIAVYILEMKFILEIKSSY